MPQAESWEKEYKNSQLITKESKPQKDALRFFKYYRKNLGLDFSDKAVLDLGCGVGRNSNYLVKHYGVRAVGYDISKTAITIANERAAELEIKVDYKVLNIGEKYPLVDNSIDLVLDVTSSNALNESEREVYLGEVGRVLKPGGIFFVRALCKEGDKNAKELIIKNPGREDDTYVNTGLGLTERVFSRDDILSYYSKFFQVLEITKKTGYQRFRGKSYKRNYWLLYLKSIK